MPFSKSLIGTVSPASRASMKRFVLLARQRAVQIVLAVALAVARERVHLREVERRGLDDRRHGVVEVEVVGPEQRADRARRAPARSAARSRSTTKPSAGISRASSRTSSISGRAAIASVTRPAKTSRSIASASPAGTAAARAERIDERIEGFHLALQQPDGVARVVGAEGVRADELRAAVRLVRRGPDDRPHLVEAHAVPAPRQLPGALRAGEARADDRDGRCGHRSRRL